MYRQFPNIVSVIDDFSVEDRMRYSNFVPRLYNLCKSFGFEAGSMLPSRAFCSDENQGYPIILLAKHFGAFPFNHGRVGGVVSTARHGPFAHHGKDLVIVQASHVGYEPETDEFGYYRRLHSANHECTSTCGKIGSVLSWYQEHFEFAKNSIFLGMHDGHHVMTIDENLLQDFREEGIFLYYEGLVECENGFPVSLDTHSPQHIYKATQSFIDAVGQENWPTAGFTAVGNRLEPNNFYFRRTILGDLEGHDHLERNLTHSMPWIVSAKEPMLAAAQINTHIEFDRTVRSIIRDNVYEHKKLFFISCLNIDISPTKDINFPTTECVPWSAYLQFGKGNFRTFSQKELIQLLRDQSAENPDQINLEESILQMETQ